jgi:type IV secretory pathway VirB2 component (pilin)
MIMGYRLVQAVLVVTVGQLGPELISGPFAHGLVIVFAVSAGLAVIAGLASLLRGGRAGQGG